MKKKIFILLLVCLFCVTGCQGEDEAKAPGEKQEAVSEEDSEKKAEALEEAFGDYMIEPNEALKAVFSKSWDVRGTADVYMLETDGTGLKNEEPFTYECGFDEENNIILKFFMDGGEETAYIAASDATGYGLDLTPVADGEFMNFFPTDLTLLEVSDERAAGLVGTWKDDNGNEYVFQESRELLIKGNEAETPGSWCAIEKEDGTLIINLVVEGGSLEFEYKVIDEGKTLELYNRSGESWYYWYR